MLTKKRYGIKDMAKWTRMETLVFALISATVTVLYEVFDLTFLSFPWTPIAVVGTAVAFMIGFQNNAAYGRIWEARKIWGGIVNTSRTWGMKIKDMVTNEHADDKVSDDTLKENVRVFVYRHIAWLTALRHAMRQKKEWENFMEHRTNKEWSHLMNIPELVTPLDEDLTDYLSTEELNYVMQKGNKATALLYLQSKNLRELKEQGYIWEFSFLELENVLEELFTLQGKSERIKNFPYPRQYATLGYYFVWVFILLLPFGIVPEFDKLAGILGADFPFIAKYFIWLAIPFHMIISWVFHTMERVGRAGENPFEGTANDVPISTISRGIEIDLRQMLDEDPETIPEQFEQKLSVQM